MYVHNFCYVQICIWNCFVNITNRVMTNHGYYQQKISHLFSNTSILSPGRSHTVDAQSVRAKVIRTTKEGFVLALHCYTTLRRCATGARNSFYLVSPIEHNSSSKQMNWHHAAGARPMIEIVKRDLSYVAMNIGSCRSVSYTHRVSNTY